jgi:hypothetical protein
MKAAFHLAALPWIAALAAVPMPACAQDEPPFEITLDMDNDGQIDRAVITTNPDDGSADLSLYLAAGEGKLDPARKPDFVKKALTEERILGLESKGKGSLVITSCFGCGASKSTEETLTVVYRRGKFLVGGYSRSWDWGEQKADGTVETTLGGCDINYLTGKATVSKDLEAGRPIKGKFKPVPLKDWSYEKRPKACEF